MWRPEKRKEAHRILTEGTELLPHRPDAWAARARMGGTTKEARLADRHAARTRGMTEGHYWTRRGRIGE